MKIYNIIGGVNGCGKTSLTGVLKTLKYDLGTIIDTDKLAKEAGSNMSGARIAIKKINEYMDNGYTFTQETTLSGVKTLKTIKKAKENDYLINLYYIGLDEVEESLSRIDNRVKKGGHDIPEADVRKRYSKRFVDLIKILKYCDTAIFFDNNNGFVPVAEYKNGELTINANAEPKWIWKLNELYR